MAMNIGTAFTYNTNIGSQQTSMLASQNAGFGSSGMSGSAFGGYAQIFGVLASAWGSRISAKNDRQNLKFQGDMARQNAAYSAKATLLGASYAEAMGRINANAVRDTARANMQIAELGAQSALQQGQQQVASQTLKAGQLKATQRAAMAANGIDLGEGNAVDVLASTEIMKDIDKEQITSNAIRNAWGYRTQGVSAMIDGNTQAVNIEIGSRTQAQNIRSQGAQELFSLQSSANSSYAASNAISPDSQFTNTLINGAMGVADTWYRRSKVA